MCQFWSTTETAFRSWSAGQPELNKVILKILINCFLTHHPKFMYFVTELKLITISTYIDQNYYFEILEPRVIGYIFKVRPAKDFGTSFVSSFGINIT